jgi:long-subunit fatty acid transport protein
MKKITLAGAALLASTAIASAGGIERTGFTTGILFEEGTYVELSYGSISPSVTGNVTGFPAATSGDISPTYNTLTLGYHQDITDALSFSLVLDEPVGASVAYPTGTGYAFAGSYAELSSHQITAALRYELNDNFSVYGGIRGVQVEGDVYVSVAGAFTYALSADTDYELGYMVGAAYERPDIALRVALTYFSEVDLSLSGVESPAGPGTAEAAILAAAPATSFNNTLPQSVLLEAQSGIAANTLLFGSIRWTNWDGYAITPNAYPTPSGNLVDYDEDVWTYTLGIARRINENWAVSASVGYEAEQDGFSGNLGPTDGFTSFGLGAEYTQGNMSIAAGVRYVRIGDANTVLNPVGPVTSDFHDNDVVAFGLRVGFNF